MLSQLFKQPVFVVISAFGCLLIMLGIFKVEDIGKLDFSPHSPPVYLSLIMGILLTATGVALYAATKLSVATFAISDVKRLPDGYSVVRGRFVLNVLIGKVETVDCSRDDCMIALPANEFFDDECINDSGSALGSYMQHHFKDNIPKIQALVNKILRDEPYEEVEKEPGTMVRSYHVGKCIYLDRPLSSHHRIAMVAVTTKRANEGLQSDARYVLEAIASIQREMANHRLTHLYVPILGSGHGGLKPEMSLVCMLIAFAELHRRQVGHHLKTVNIIVFKRDDTSAPSISTKDIKRALGFASRFLEE